MTRKLTLVLTALGLLIVLSSLAFSNGMMNVGALMQVPTTTTPTPPTSHGLATEGNDLIGTENGNVLGTE